MKTRSQASSPWGVFPHDIWCIIFGEISDVPTLAALALSNSTLHKTFMTNASSFSFAALSKEIPAAIFPEATAAWSSSDIEPWSKDRVLDFLQHYHANREAQISQFWTLAKARQVSKLYRCSRLFASEFCASVLSSRPRRPPSRLEVNRIERSFLRFELYGNLFRNQWPSQESGHRFHPEEQREIYFRYYAAWENEQLACVHDYLFRRLSISFNELALHDVKWGKSEVDIVGDDAAPRNFQKEYVLSMGLVFLRDLVDAHTYEQRHQLLGPPPPSDDRFLHEGLENQPRYNTWREFRRHMLQESSSIDKPFFHDAGVTAAAEDDTGPAKAWNWAYGKRNQDREVFRSYYDPSFYDLRAWGFVWWDCARLNDWGHIRRSVSQRKIQGNSYVDYMPKDLVPSKKELVKSWGERAKVWDQGGRGWWAERDKSRIVWNRA